MEQRSRSSGEQRTAPRIGNKKQQSTITTTNTEAHGFNPWASALCNQILFNRNPIQSTHLTHLNAARSPAGYPN